MMARGLDINYEDPDASTVVQVVVGEAHTLALTASGSVYTWGRGQFGRMGMGVFQDELVPTLIEFEAMAMEHEDSPSSSAHPTDWDSVKRSRISQLAAGAYHSLALAGDGSVWSWGFNAYGQLGRQRAASYPALITFPRSSSFSFDESQANSTSWNEDCRDSDGSNPKVMVVEAGGMMSSAVDDEGGLWLWGAVPEPSAGVRITDSDQYYKSESFELANINQPERVLALRGLKVRRVACGNEHILVLVDGPDGIACYSWGSNAYGQLGLSDFEARDVPTQVTALAAHQVGVIVDFSCGAFHSAIVTMKEDDSSDHGGDSESSSMAGRMHVEQGMASPRLRARVPSDQYLESLASPKGRARQTDRQQLGYPYNAASNNGFRNHSSYGSHSDSNFRGHLPTSSMASWIGNGAMRTQASKRDGLGDGDVRLSTCWTFGQNENGQLGIGTCENSHTPVAVDALPTHERIQTVVCGLFHTAVVTDSGDVWVWGMEGGLGQCPGIGPPGSKSGDALTPVRVFGESSAKCNRITGSKGIACGAAHTVTVSNGGRDLWAWGRGKNGVLGLGHHSDSWFPSPVLWPPGCESSRDSDADGPYDAYRKSSSRASSKGGSRGKGDEIRPYVREVDDNKPPRSSSYSRLPAEAEQYVREVREVESRPPRDGLAIIRKAMESPGRPIRRGDQSPVQISRRGDLSPGQGSKRGDLVLEFPGRLSRGMQSPSRPSRRGDHFWPPMQPEPENPKSFRRETGTEPSSTSISGFKYQVGGTPLQSEDVSSLKAELIECRRYTESLHAAIYGGIESFPIPLTGNSSSPHDSRFNPRKAIGLGSQNSALQDWQDHVEEAPLEELAKLEQFYKGMRNRLKDVLFQRKMEDWCRRVMSGLSAGSYQDPPPVRESYSAQSTPYFEEPGMLAQQRTGVMSDRREMLSPAALAASLAEFRKHSQHRR
ncbi:uncharacterized protein [Physcomitrium patens]|uniref:uncharacterized protein isoform X3 n=1 Tax=Physcomitrium patens TaxID=3218 RepID=UPI000D16506C|nr:uncharacterized protein LOC112274125 isoform X3 [Physcomitrium patens]|eukprot:XP_024359081.1 uncharacterized protein LOC112274125 isoform X3 [Physcomitrella patens]